MFAANSPLAPPNHLGNGSGGGSFDVQSGRGKSTFFIYCSSFCAARTPSVRWIREIASYNVGEMSVPMPKRAGESRPTFSAELRGHLLRVARERGRPETEISPLLEALAKEWIEKESYRRREEELQEITERLAAVEDQLRALIEAPVNVPSHFVFMETRKATSAKLDNLARRVLDFLVGIADEDHVTPRISAKEIAAKIARQSDQPTGKKITERIKKLVALRLVAIEEESGGGGGRSYRIEQPEP